MKRILSIIPLLISVTAFCQRANILFDSGWKFNKGNVENAWQPGFDDRNWRAIDLPHDWSIEDIPGMQSPFDPKAVNGVAQGFATGGTSWYRKTFRVPGNMKNKKIQVYFEGVYMNADVWLNGHHLGNHPYGYTSYFYDISDKIKPDGENVLAVQVKDEGANSRWYSGSGIYRHVWLKFFNPVHISTWGTSITTPQISSSLARVNIKSIVKNIATGTQIRYVTRVLDASGKQVAVSALSSTTKDSIFERNIEVHQPRLWSPGSPYLYKAVVDVYVNGKPVDREVTKFGIRQTAFSVEKGFSLNGIPMKMKGACIHHDNGPLGAVSNDAAEVRKVALLKSVGFNAIRASHNPPSTALLNACDSLGMLVIDEAFDGWVNQKNKDDYHLYFKEWWQRDLESMLLRDRNHPSVIIWSIGNEINLKKETVEEVEISKKLTEFVHRFEPTRPVISAVFQDTLAVDKDPMFATLDIAGYNYSHPNIEKDHQRVPGRKIITTESFPFYAFEYWMDVIDHPYVMGDFVWTGMDYIGESSIGWIGFSWMSLKDEKTTYPWNLAYCGDLDICGWRRPQSYYREALWEENKIAVFVTPPKPSNKPAVPGSEWFWYWPDVLPDWTWKGYEGQPLQVSVYSSCDETELFLNGKSLGRKPTNRSTRFTATWSVPYTAGELKAVGYSGSKQVAVSKLETAGEASQIQLLPEKKVLKADGQDLVYVTVNVTDAKGILQPKADQTIHFSVSGPASIVGVGNANPVSVESYQLPQRKAWKGKCMVVLKSTRGTGAIHLKATGAGLRTATTILFAN